MVNYGCYNSAGKQNDYANEYCQENGAETGRITKHQKAQSKFHGCILFLSQHVSIEQTFVFAPAVPQVPPGH
jgi:hypothetical protein